MALHWTLGVPQERAGPPPPLPATEGARGPGHTESTSSAGHGAACCDKDFTVTGGAVLRQGCITREGTSEATPEAVRQAVEGGLPRRLWAVTVGYKCH